MDEIGQLPVACGDAVSFSKTVAESDAYLFAGITGDFSPNHVDEEKMKHSQFGGRILHGALLVGFMSTTSTMLIERCIAASPGWTVVALGYDRLRFVAPVRFGDTITVHYEISGIQEDKDRTTANITITNQNGDTVAAGIGLLKWTRNRQDNHERQS